MRWSSLVARLSDTQKVIGSNPVLTTIFIIMNIQEMHVAINTEMNKINSALFENILPQEIDFALNNNILRFAKQRYSVQSNLKQKGFEMSQKRIDDLRTLVTPNYTAKAFLPLSYDPDLTEKVLFYFPADYMLAVNSRFKVANNECGTFTYTTATVANSLDTLDINALSITNWANFRIRNNTDSFVLSLGANATEYNATDDLTYVVRVILQKLRDQYNYSQYEFYWEYYHGKYYKNKIVIVNKSTTDWEYSTNGSTYTDFTAVTEDTLTYYSNTPNSSTSGKLVQEDDIFAMQADPFNKTIPDFPLYFTSNYNYNVFIDRNIFVVTDVILSYIRTPKTVSYYLNQDCDLPEHTHPEIVSMTVDYLLEAIQAGERYKTHQEIVATNE